LKRPASGDRIKNPEVGDEGKFLQPFIQGQYLPPVLWKIGPDDPPPQIIIEVPVQTALCLVLATGTFAPVEVGLQESTAGL
jgi:hypothetical protein